MKFATSTCLIFAAGVLEPTLAFAPVSPVATYRATHQPLSFSKNSNEEIIKSYDFPGQLNESTNDNKWMAPVGVASLATLTPLAAEAATGDANPLASAVAAYGHYLSLLVMVGALMYERLTVAPAMPKDTEKTLVIADAIYGLSAVTLLVSGYYRAVQYGKGWYFYSHEPIFWVKMIFFMILGAASLFPTITSIKRGSLLDSADWEPMSEALAARMTTVINAELLMMASIPLAATLMSRGIGYTESIPAEIIGPILTGLTAVGLGFKYAKEAITWSEEEDSVTP